MWCTSMNLVEAALASCRANNIRLWESSWGADVAVWDTDKGVAFDASKIRKIEHKGEYGCEAT